MLVSAEQIEFSKVYIHRAELLNKIHNAVIATIQQAKQQSNSNYPIETQAQAFRICKNSNNPNSFFYRPMIQDTRPSYFEIEQLKAKRRIEDAQHTLNMLEPVEAALLQLKDGVVTIEVYNVLYTSQYMVPQLDELFDNVIPPSGKNLGRGSHNE